MGNLLFIYLFIEMKEKIARTNNVNNVNVRVHEDKSYKNHDKETWNCNLLAIYTFLVSVFCSTAIDNKNKCDALSCGEHLVLLISNDINDPSLNEIGNTKVGQHLKKDDIIKYTNIPNSKKILQT